LVGLFPWYGLYLLRVLPESTVQDRNPEKLTCLAESVLVPTRSEVPRSDQGGAAGQPPERHRRAVFAGVENSPPILKARSTRDRKPGRTGSQGVRRFFRATQPGYASAAALRGTERAPVP